MWVSRIVAASIVLTLTGCGSGGGGSEQPSPEADPPSSSTTPSASPTPTYVEPADCRRALATVEQVVDSMERDSLGKSTFDAQNARIGRLADRAETTCSNHVMRPLRKALYEWAVADLWWTGCPGRVCDMKLVTKRVVAGIEATRRSVELANR